MKWKCDYLRSLSGGENHRGRIGLPFCLNMLENLPFWYTFFTRLGFEVVLSPESSRALYSYGQHTIPSDTVCYPAKIIHGHIEKLLEMDVDAIFYPCLPYNFDEGKGDNHYNCPVVAYYPELIEANVSGLKRCGISTISGCTVRVILQRRPPTISARCSVYPPARSSRLQERHSRHMTHIAASSMKEAKG